MSRNVLPKKYLHIKPTFASFVYTVDKAALLLPDSHQINNLTGVALSMVAQLHPGHKHILRQQVGPDSVTGKIGIAGVVNVGIDVGVAVMHHAPLGKVHLLRETKAVEYAK